MKNKFLITLLSISAVGTFGCKQSSVAPTASSDNQVTSKLKTENKVTIPDRSKSGLMTYFASMVSSQKIVTGQQVGNGEGWVGSHQTADAYTTYIESLNTATGLRPAIIGGDYGWYTTTNTTTVNTTLLNHWNKGGLVELSWHADNPFESGPYSPNYASGKSTDAANIANTHLNWLLASFTPTTQAQIDARTSYRTELAKVADGLVALKNAGVTVIWRPFHECNGNWFWWGVNNLTSPTNTADYKNLWIDMYNYFASRGLNNLIWVYSVNIRWGTFAPYNAMYPGSAYVDLVGIDIYNATPVFPAGDLTEMQALGKTLVASEIGPKDAGLGNYNEVDALNMYRGKAAYFLQWSSWASNPVAIIDNLNYNSMLWDANSISID